MAGRIRRALGALIVVAALVPAQASAHQAANVNVLLDGFITPFTGQAVNNDQPAEFGRFGAPFSEPTIDGKRTDDKCVENGGDSSPTSDSRHLTCKPTGVSINVLPIAKRVMYYDGLEGTENIRTSIVAEFGHNAGNDQSRLLNLAGPSWSVPTPSDGGANPKGYKNDPLFPPPLSTTEPWNDGALFCSDNKFLADGRVISLGGTSYYLDPGVENGDSAWGVSELEGLRSSRIYDPESNTWSQSGEMKYGRWYPTAVTLANGRLMVASGVTSRGCTCCPTARSSTTPPASRSTRSATHTTRPAGTRPPCTTRRPRCGPTSAFREPATDRRSTPRATPATRPAT